MSQADRESIFTKKNLRNILVIVWIFKIIKIKCLTTSDTKHRCIYSCLQSPPSKNWFQYVSRVYATVINFPCSTLVWGCVVYCLILQVLNSAQSRRKGWRVFIWPYSIYAVNITFVKLDSQFFFVEVFYLLNTEILLSEIRTEQENIMLIAILKKWILFVLSCMFMYYQQYLTVLIEILYLTVWPTNYTPFNPPPPHTPLN